LSSFRPERVAEQIHKEVCHLMMHGIKDPRVSSVTITGVKVTRDLSLARIYFSVSDEVNERKDAERGLKSVAPYVRRRLGQVMQMRSIPEIRFAYDSSIGYGQKIDDLLRQVQNDLKDDSADS